QTPDSLAVDLLSLLGQHDGHPTTAEERCPEILLVDPPPQPQVLDRLLGRLVVEARPVEAQQLAPASNAQLRVARFDQGSPRLDLTGQIFFHPRQLHIVPPESL